MENMLTVEEVAEILKVKPITVRQMYREKRLRAKRARSERKSDRRRPSADD